MKITILLICLISSVFGISRMKRRNLNTIIQQKCTLATVEWVFEENGTETTKWMAENYEGDSTKYFAKSRSSIDCSKGTKITCQTIHNGKCVWALKESEEESENESDEEYENEDNKKKCMSRCRACSFIYERDSKRNSNKSVLTHFGEMPQDIYWEKPLPELYIASENYKEGGELLGTKNDCTNTKEDGKYW
jgi:hypothetical protein